MWKAAQLIVFVLVFGQRHSAIDDVFRQVKEEYDDKMMRVETGHSVQSDWCRYRMKGSNRTLVKLHYDMVIDVRTYKDAFRQDFKHDGDSCETHSVVSPSANRRKRIASKSDERRWPLEIPYQIEKGFGTAGKRTILKAMALWSRHTCLHFVEATDQYDHIIFSPLEDACESNVGRMSGPQYITLDRNHCMTLPIILHQIGHAIGLYHEHNRADRDNYILVNYKNIKQINYYNFEKLIADQYLDFNKTYDYHSIMHYGKNFFADPLNAISMAPIDEDYLDIIGEARQLSFHDVQIVNAMYKCKERCAHVECPIGAFVGKNCECFCQGPPEDPVLRCTRDRNVFCEPPPFDLAIYFVYPIEKVEPEVLYADGTVLIVENPRCSKQGTGTYTCQDGEWLVNFDCKPDRCVYDRTRYEFEPKPNSTTCGDCYGPTTEYVDTGTHLHVECRAPKRTQGYDSECRDSIWFPELPNCDADCALGSYSVNCSKQCHCRLGPCEVVTGACKNGGCKDGWKGIACNESCQLGSYSVNCSKQCYCRVGPCDGVTGACGNGGCKDEWKGIACNENKTNEETRCQLGSYSVNCSKQCYCRVGPCDGVTGACGNGGCKDEWTGITCNQKCGGVLTDPFGVITSPNYPQDYENYIDCTWFINAPEGRRINVNFTDFRFESCDFCECDYLELFNEPNASLPSSGKLCGTAPPIGFQSQSNSVRIVLFTNNHTTRKGFRLNYTFSTQADEDKEHSSTFTWIATTLGLCLLIVSFTTTACLCIRRKKRKRAEKTVQMNELKPSDIPLELIDSNSGHYDVLPDDNNEDNSSNYDVLPNDNSDDNTDHYDVLPDDVHDDCIVPYAVVPLGNTAREATTMYTSRQPEITDDYLHTGLRESSYMIPDSSYVLGRIGDSETSVQTNSAVAGVLDNAATSETKYKASEELINVTKEITTNASAKKLFDYGKSEENFEAETNYTGDKQEKTDDSGETNYTDFEFLENDTQAQINKESGINEYVFVLK